MAAKRRHILLDTGPLVALLVKTDRHHERVKKLFDTLPPPFSTCEAVLSEACFLMSKIDPKGPAEILELGKKGFYEIPFRLSDELSQINALLTKYVDTPISLADACLIRMAEILDTNQIVTFDSDFLIYRWKKTRQFLPLIRTKP